MLSGNKDVDRQILMGLDTKSLLTACNAYGNANRLCDDDFFKHRFRKDFLQYVNDKPANKGWRQFYLEKVYDADQKLKVETEFPGDVNQKPPEITWRQFYIQLIRREICKFIEENKDVGKEKLFYIETINDSSSFNYVMAKIIKEHENYSYVSPEEFYSITYNRYFKGNKYLSPKPEITPAEISLLKREIVYLKSDYFPKNMSDFINELISRGRLNYDVKIGEICALL